MLFINDMRTIFRAYKFRLLPSENQTEKLARHFGSVRFVYNHFLAERKRQYDEYGKSDDYYVQAKKLTEMKHSEEFSWLKDNNSQTLQFALRCLETAYVNFFRKQAKFPRFKARKHGGSFTVPQHCRLEDGRIYIPKFKEGIKVRAHRELKGEIRQMTFSLTPSGKYFVSILTEETHIPFAKTDKAVGIDLGLKAFITTSDGDKYKNNRYLKKYERRLADAQRHLSRKKKGSRSYEKQRGKVARIHEKIANCRLDTLHKVSLDLVRKYDIICTENLNVKAMMGSHRLAKGISDASWGMFLTFLEYKAAYNDKTVVKIDRFYPSSKSCSHCGWIKSDMRLSDREWTCPHCGTHHDRDINAAKNILREGMKIYKEKSAGHADYTDGDGVRLDNERLSVKSGSPRL